MDSNMPDKKLTDKEVVKAMECRLANTNANCIVCHFNRSNQSCIDVLIQYALDLINRLQAENERLNKEVDRLSQVVLYNDSVTEMKVEEAKAEAYKEFAEVIFELFPNDKPNTVISRVTVKYILKDLVG